MKRVNLSKELKQNEMEYFLHFVYLEVGLECIMTI